ncbi:PTS glucose transporter subunit IIA [Acidaminobacter sp. JC074]|uniref:PTS sugar transporter subunit IIA n=1 Tax=Acidaminobacter sp. JC074 TaxID=2530199 RepID=UPI001F10F9EA|nr:PTS glucose transporter subunit IIA [Acidaminobacter sp. JC074]MCH4886155.1 PTS glucose transporter subunit IIA [Acidaminobacter sp. JC074]
MRLLKKDSLRAITTGQLLDLSQVKDPVFNQKMMGEGVAFVSDSKVFYAPCNGVITFLAETKHAIGIKSDKGLEIIIHIGLDTVNLKGEGFISYCREQDEIKAGDKLIELSNALFENPDIDLTTPLVITNYTALKNLDIDSSRQINSIEEKVITFKT